MIIAFILSPMPQPSPANYPWSVKVIFAIYSICFLIGTYTHASGILHLGFVPHPVPLAIGVYWDALTVLDLLTAVLLWWRPKPAIGLAVAIMVSDVIINTHTYLAGYFRPPTPNMVPLSLLDQALFALFVLVTAPLAYRQLRQLSPPTGAGG